MNLRHLKDEFDVGAFGSGWKRKVTGSIHDKFETGGHSWTSRHPLVWSSSRDMLWGILEQENKKFRQQKVLECKQKENHKQIKCKFRENQVCNKFSSNRMSNNLWTQQTKEIFPRVYRRKFFKLKSNRSCCETFEAQSFLSFVDFNHNSIEFNLSYLRKVQTETPPTPASSNAVQV